MQPDSDCTASATHSLSPWKLAMAWEGEGEEREREEANRKWPRTLISHGVDDRTVPVTSSVEFVKELAKKRDFR